MKKFLSLTILIVFILSIAIAVCGCQKTNNVDVVDTELEKSEISKTNTSILNTIQFETKMTKIQTESISPFATENQLSVDVKEYAEENVQKSMKISILGKEYVAEYKNSAELPWVDQTVHVYRLAGTENSSIYVDAKSGKVVEYLSVPLSSDIKLSCEEDYKKFIENFIDSEYDLSKYEYLCRSHYFERSNFGSEAKLVDKYHTCTENERLIKYSFFYTKKHRGISTYEGITALFYEDTFFFEIRVHELEETDFTDIVDNMTFLETHVIKSLDDYLYEGSEIDEINILSHQLGVKNSIPYVLTTVDIKWHSTNSPDVRMTTRVQMVSNVFNTAINR